jgi:hypothetical protein
MSKAKEFIKEVNTKVIDTIVTLEVIILVEDTGDASPKKIGEIVRKALLDNIESGGFSRTLQMRAAMQAKAISVSVEGLKQ